MSITAYQLTYLHPDKELLFRDLSFSLQKGERAGLVGDNGSGKSTLLQIMSGILLPSSGKISCDTFPYYVPQHFGQYDHFTIAQVLRIEKKLHALAAILEGNVSTENYLLLEDDWSIEEKTIAALSYWGLNTNHFSQKFSSLSGGEKTKIFLAGITLHQPEIILMDEPTNHLDSLSRKKVYDFIQTSHATLVVVSHDRKLLNLFPAIYELEKESITYYPGNYDCFKSQKDRATEAAYAKIEEKEKALRLARKTAREVAQRKQKLDARGGKRNEKKGISKMAMDTLRDRAEKSSSKLKSIHTEKLETIIGDLSGLRNSLPQIQSMKIDFNHSLLHTGKTLVKGKDINFSYDSGWRWKNPLNFQIRSGDRIAIKGLNGSGKTTLLHLIAGTLKPVKGTLERVDFTCVYLDQEYSIIKDSLSVLEQLSLYNTSWRDHEIKTILNRFLFSFETWDKPCKKLSGGEKMKLALCCLMVSAHTPDMFILDEPTNNIDIQNIDILSNTIKDYKGTVLVVSHDESFLEQIGIEHSIIL